MGPPVAVVVLMLLGLYFIARWIVRTLRLYVMEIDPDDEGDT